MMVSVLLLLAICTAAVLIISSKPGTDRHRARRLILTAELATAVIAVPVAAIQAGPGETIERSVADNCIQFDAFNAYCLPGGPGGLRGGSVSAGAPSQELLTLKNWCNDHIGGCSSYFFYPPGPVNRPDVAIRHSP